MKLRGRNVRWSESQVNVTPLIDVVMVLIVFFMLVAKIGVTTGAEQMDLPETITGSKIESMGNTLTLNVRPGPASEPMVTALVDVNKVELKVIEPATGKRQLLDALTYVRQQKGPDFQVIIRAEKNMPYRYLEPVLLACAEAHVKNVSFTTAIVMEAR